MTTRPYLETSPEQSAKRQKSFHDLSTDTDMSDTNMSGMQPTSSIASTTSLHLTHGPLDHDLHGPHSTSAYTPSTSSLGASDPSQPTTQGLNSSLMTGTAPPQTNGSLQEAIVALQVKKLVPNAKVPTRGSKFAAGYDMYASETKTVPARGKAMIGTGIAVAVPIGTYGRVAPRSGLASKHSIATGAGVIDYDYRGEVKVLLFNHSDVDFVVQEGDRMAQLVLERIVTPEVMEVQELEDSERGAGGFGSTGGFGVVVGNVGV